MNPNASFDILYTTNCLEIEYGGLFQQEIQNLLYLSSLLFLFEGNPLSDWGYYFISIDNMPFCEEIPIQLDLMKKYKYIVEKNNKYKLSNEGLMFLNQIYNLSYINKHKRYIDACTDSVLSIPLPLLNNSINNESMLNDIKKNPRRELLGEGILFNILYKDFEGLKQVVKDETTDLWLIATLWIKYLNVIDEKGE